MLLTGNYYFFLCSAVDCGPLNNIPNGEVSFEATTLDSIATYTCNSGYALLGNATRMCRNDGVWDCQPPVCQRKRLNSIQVNQMITTFIFAQLLAVVPSTTYQME